MADIPSSRVKINDIEVSADAPVTEALFNKIGADINDYLDKGLQYEEFLANGTWTCPDNVDWVILHGCGGGGGGAGGNNNQADDWSPNDINAPGGGGAGAAIKTVMVPVTPGNVYTINIGSGGSAGAAGTGIIGYGGSGGDGGNTTFIGADASVYFRGAPGGAAGLYRYTVNGVGSLVAYGAVGRAGLSRDGGANGGGFIFALNEAANGGNSIYASGGSGNGVSTTGGGGGAAFGAGASGGAPSGAGSSAAANSGAGGGGGGQGPGLGVGTTGGAGGSGRLKIFWYGNA